MNAEDFLFILYTSGSTGKPKGVVHSTAGYLLWSALTHKYVFDIHEGDVYFCTADIGWVTGHSYVIYGPLCNGGTTSLSALVHGSNQASVTGIVHLTAPIKGTTILIAFAGALVSSLIDGIMRRVACGSARSGISTAGPRVMSGRHAGRGDTGRRHWKGRQRDDRDSTDGSRGAEGPGGSRSALRAVTPGAGRSPKAAWPSRPSGG